MPAELRDLAWKNQKTVYSLMFDCVQDVLKTFTRNDKKLQGNAGFTAILHTHSRALGHHPHIHVVMPGASINPKSGLWRKKSGKYLFSNKTGQGIPGKTTGSSCCQGAVRIPLIPATDSTRSRSLFPFDLGQ